jgi:hypothetical protein
MGLMGLRFKARRGERREDGGADITHLNLDTACALGLDESTAPKIQVKAPGDVTLVGYELDAVEFTHRRRKAQLPRVFVPVEAEVGTGADKRVVPAKRNEEQLIGHDFMQAANAKQDFERHVLEGQSAYGQLVRPKTKILPATLAQRVRLQRAPRCVVRKRRRSR